MRAYLLLLLTAAAVAWLTTPLARRLATASGAITAVRARDVHTEPIPRMGGVAMLAGIAVALVVGAQIPFLAPVFAGPTAWAILGAAGAVTLLGVADDIWDLDWLTKLVGQVLAAGLMAWWGGVQLYALPIAGLTIPSSRQSLFATVLVVVVAINAVNFVDGLDGLAAGTVAIAALTYGVVAASRGSHDLAVFASALTGACVGFAWFNCHPAQVIMGDTGSLALGAALGCLAILTKTELLLVLVGGVFVVEALSVVIQVTYFRLTHGKRVFRMSPLHHHFELSGWQEPKVVTRFWILGLVFSVLGMLCLPAF